MTKKAIILSSGGLDSTTTLAVAKSEGYELYALSFDYGQKHRIEIERAKKIAKQFSVKDHLVMKIDLRQIGGSSLTSDMEVPKDRTINEISKGIPITYVPARNTIFLSFALAWGEVIGAYHIFIGVNALDYSGYPDCRQDYIDAFTNMARLGTKAGVEGSEITIHTPLIHMTKKEIIEKGLELGVNYANTLSCYDPSPSGKPCGKCDSCLLREKGFQEAGVKDPIN